MALGKGPIISIVTVLVIGLWMATGALSPKEVPEKTPPVSPETSPYFKVQVQRFHSSSLVPELTLQGETAPSREVHLSSEVAGRVLSIAKREGDFVKKGEVILKIDPKGKRQQLAQAKALLKQRQLEHKANRDLIGRGLQNETRLAQSEAALEEAKALVAQLTIELDATQVKAPFSGILENRKVEIGTYLRVGDPVISVLDFNPFLIVANVAEKDRHLIQAGTQANGTTIDGTVVKGNIRYVAASASKGSRTFALELEVANPSERQADGTTAQVHVPLPKQEAIFISPALLSLNQNGLLGAKHINDQAHVIFTPVEIVKAEAQGVWVAGLPNPVDLITVGQSFVSAGEKVTPVFEKAQPIDEAIGQTPSAAGEVN